MNMKQRSPRNRMSRSTADLLFADIGMLALAMTTVWWLLASPIIPFHFNIPSLFIGAFVFGIPLGGIGILLNHAAARSEVKPQGRR